MAIIKERESPPILARRTTGEVAMCCDYLYTVILNYLTPKRVQSSFLRNIVRD